MKIYLLKRIQFLPTSLEEAWQFFSSPQNLAKITPAKMNFRILYISGMGHVYPGQLIRYRITVLPLVTVHWVTEITHVREMAGFVDEQRFGPYRMWHHQHNFNEVVGGVEMTDEVNYAIPFGILGRLAHWLFVGRLVNAIFEYRSKMIKEMFPIQK